MKNAEPEPVARWFHSWNFFYATLACSAAIGIFTARFLWETRGILGFYSLLIPGFVAGAATQLFRSIEALSETRRRLQRLWRTHQVIRRRPDDITAQQVSHKELIDAANCYIEMKLHDSGKAPAKSALPLLDHLCLVAKDVRIIVINGPAGAGKTILLRVLYSRLCASASVFLLPCGLKRDIIEEVRNLSYKPLSKDTIVLVDGLDEDPGASINASARLLQLLEWSRHFRKLIISYRTALQDSHLMLESLSEHWRNQLLQLRIASLDATGIRHVIAAQLPISELARRHKYFQLADQLEGLSPTPLVAAQIPHLDKNTVDTDSTYLLFKAIFTAWAARERGIDTESFTRLAVALAWHIHEHSAVAGGEFVTDEELVEVARNAGLQLEGWRLSGRSVLLRAADGSLRFAHRTMMEYLIVKRIIDGHPTPSSPLTDKMSELLADALSRTAAGSQFQGIRLVQRSLATSSHIFSPGSSFFACRLEAWTVEHGRIAASCFLNSSLAFSEYHRVMITDTYLTRCDLAGFEIDGRLESVVFEECSLASSRFGRRIATGSTGSSPTTYGCILHDVIFRAIEGRDCRFRNAEAYDGRWEGGDFSDSVFRTSYFKGCNFTEVDLSHSIFDKAKFQDCEFYAVSLKKCWLQSSRFTGCKFQEMDLTVVDKTGSKFIKCEFIDCQIPKNLRELSSRT